MRAVWFINVDHTIAQREDLHWTQRNASCTSEASIFVDDEFVI